MLAILFLERCRAVLEGATCLATGKKGFIVTHRGSGTPGKYNPTLILVQFDWWQAVCQKHSLVLLFGALQS